MRPQDAESEEWAGLRERLERAGVRRRAAVFAPDAMTLAGLETRTAADRYHWDGRRRGADAAHPYVVFQVTLDGWGVYEDTAAGARPVPPGRAFAAVVPSAHRYYLPPESDRWGFFWVMLRHPYVARRMLERQRAGGGGGAAAAVLGVRPDSPVVARAAALYAGGFADRFAEEAAVFDLLMAYERHVHDALSGGGTAGAVAARDALLAETRARVLADPSRPLSVAEVAAAHGMSRTRFSHHFKAVAGQPPGEYMARVRMEEAARRLVHTPDTLAAVAAATGFADANHLCKAFRRRFHTSPGTFRRQMR